jgi:sialic acid synthase SpsE/sugar phosphate isomerase/epimerase
MTEYTICISNKAIGGSEATYIIAEIGNNHNGSLERAFEMVDLSAEMGVDCAKFQMRHIEEVYRKKSLERTGDDLSTEYTLDLLEKFELSIEDHQKLFEYCEKKGILYLCTPWDAKSLAVLEKMGVAAYKVASADLTNLPLIGKLCETGKPLILSTGMSRRDEVEKTVNYLEEHKAVFALLHCNSTYPAPYHDININYLETLAEIHSLVGYSGHERGTAVSVAAVAKGAKIIERHFTLNRNMEGPDHAASLGFEDFKRLVTEIRQVESALGEAGERVLSQGEMMNRESLAKSLVASRPLKKGDVVTLDDVKALSPGQGLNPQYLDQLIGITLKRDLDEESYFFITDINAAVKEPRDYSFQHPWGVPVRYHDFNQYYQRIKPDLIEFHMSYSDMDLNLADYLEGTYDMDFLVHAPELFEGSHLMDLMSPDKDYLEKSLVETQRLIDITRELKKFFPKTKNPQIIANVGGFTMDAPLSAEIIVENYQRFAESLKKLDMEGVELIPQTMAPFPWHFGGQRYQNNFVLPDEIVDYCQRLNLRMCFDISHSKLTCNYHKIDFYEFAEKVAPYTAHLHLGDSKGFNGEGLQIGEGEIDFVKLGKILTKHCPDATFIPEIWQGHKNGGEGFWIALERLEGTL